MKKRRYLEGILLLVLLMLLCRLSCPESGGGREQKKEAGTGEEIKEEDSGMYEENARILMEGLNLKSRIGSLGTAKTLDDCGFGQISRIRSVEAFRHAWRAELEDQEGKIWTITVDEDGYLGTIKDEKGRYLYAPED